MLPRSRENWLTNISADFKNGFNKINLICNVYFVFNTKNICHKLNANCIEQYRFQANLVKNYKIMNTIQHGKISLLNLQAKQGLR